MLMVLTLTVGVFPQYCSFLQKSKPAVAEWSQTSKKPHKIYQYTTGRRVRAETRISFMWFKSMVHIIVPELILFPGSP